MTFHESCQTFHICFALSANTHLSGIASEGKVENICKLEWTLKMIISRLVNMNVYLDLDIPTPNQVLYIGFFL